MLRLVTDSWLVFSMQWWPILFSVWQFDSPISLSGPHLPAPALIPLGQLPISVAISLAGGRVGP